MKRFLTGRRKYYILAGFFGIILLNILRIDPRTPLSTERFVSVTPTKIPTFSLENNITEHPVLSPVFGISVRQDAIEKQSARVVGVRDGDTIEVDLGGGNFKTVRYIGIDTPESVDPRRSVECFGKEASNMNTSLVMNKIVQLEKDVSEVDKYGRLLRYVYADNIFVNEFLVAEGFAHASSYPPDVKFQEDLDSAENEARNAGKGLWGSCHDTTYKYSVSSDSQRNTNSGDKDCSDFATHQEAQDYFNAKGGTSANNIDKLDGSDHDGIVCETLP